MPVALYTRVSMPLPLHLNLSFLFMFIFLALTPCILDKHLHTPISFCFLISCFVCSFVYIVFSSCVHLFSSSYHYCIVFLCCSCCSGVVFVFLLLLVLFLLWSCVGCNIRKETIEEILTCTNLGENNEEIRSICCDCQTIAIWTP